MALTCVTGLLGALFGALLNLQMVGSRAAAEFGYATLAWVSAGAVALLLMYRTARSRVAIRETFMAVSICVGFATFLAGAAAPLFWLYPLSEPTGLGLGAAFAGALAYQLWRGYGNFQQCWESNHLTALESALDTGAGTLDVGRFLERLQAVGKLFVPFNSEPLNQLISAALIVSMLLGLNLRKPFPELSIWAWGVPALVFMSVFAQMALMRILLAHRLHQLEASLGKHLLVSEAFEKRKKRLLRQKTRHKN